MASPSPASHPERPAFLSHSPIPLPWNTEFVFYLLVEFVVAIICLSFTSVNALEFLEVTKWTSAAYLIARGITKAGRVHGEG
jgi:hypothetical protein